MADIIYITNHVVQINNADNVPIKVLPRPFYDCEAESEKTAIELHRKCREEKRTASRDFYLVNEATQW